MTDLIRDSNSNAIVNTNVTEYQLLCKEEKQKESKRTKLSLLVER